MNYDYTVTRTRMAENGSQDKSAWDYVFRGDGQASTLRSFEKAIELWLASLDLPKTANYNLAARLLLRQMGAVRLRGEEFAIGDRSQKPEVTTEVPNEVSGDTDTVVIEPADYTFGVQQLMTAWASMIGQSRAEKKQDVRHKFYQSLKSGPPTEAVTSFSSTYRTLVAEMESEGISVHKLGLRSRFWRRRAVRTPRTSRLRRRACVCFAGSMCKTRPQRAAPSLAQGRSHREFGRRFGNSSSASSHAYIAKETEYDENQETHDDEEPEANAVEEEGGKEEGDEQDFEAFVASLEEAEPNMSSEEYAEAEGAIAEMADALVTMREAKTRLAQVRRDRGFGCSPASTDEARASH